MVAIKCEAIAEIPEYCDYCIYYSCKPHPYKGWSECCDLCHHTMDEGDGDWYYDGNSRPKMCPLIEML